MPKALITFYSRSGNTEKMADAISQTLKKEGLAVTVKSVDKVKAAELLNFDIILIGSPTYYGSMAKEIKELLDESVDFHGQLAGKIGGAFASAANIGGGNETTILSILNALLIHGMIITGNSSGDHYGPVAIGAPDSRALKQCGQYAKIIADLSEKVVKK